MPKTIRSKTVYSNENGERVSVPAIKGRDGIDGHDPKKGIDYFTDKEKEEMIDAARSDGVYIKNEAPVKITFPTYEEHEALDEKVDALDAKVSNVSETVEDIGDRVDTVEDKVDSLDIYTKQSFSDVEDELENKASKEDLSALDDRVTVLENEPKVPETLIAQVDDNTRQIDAIKKLSKGIIWDFQTDSADGDKVVPTGGKQASIMSYGGKSVVWNQKIAVSDVRSSDSVNGASYTADGMGNVIVNGTVTGGNSYGIIVGKAQYRVTTGHKYFAKGCPAGGSESTYMCALQSLSSSAYIAYDYGSGCVVTAADDGLGYYARVMEGYTANNLIFSPKLFDLTAMGWGDITSIADPRIAWIEQYAYEHPEYNAGEIISADVESVSYQSRNLWHEDSSFTFSGKSESTIIKPFNNFNLDASKRYVLSGKCSGSTITSSNGYTFVFTLVMQDGSYKFIGASNAAIANGKFNDLIPENAVRIDRVYAHPRWTGGTATIYDIQLEEASVASEYTPYVSVSLTIPAAVRALDGYGWSAGTARNYIEQTDDGKWLYHKQVERFVIPEDTLWRVSGEYQFYSAFSGVVLAKLISNSTEKANAVIATIPTIIVDRGYRGDYTSGLGVRGAVIYIGIDDYNDRANRLDNQPVYYELETEVVTDITDLMGDALEEFEAETGGSISFDNAQMMSVPNSVQYFIALNEVVS